MHRGWRGFSFRRRFRAGNRPPANGAVVCALFHDQAGRYRNGIVHQPHYYRGPRRPALGRSEPATWGCVSFRPAGCANRMSAPECIVFVIDDDLLVRESVADLLNSAGFTVQTFGSATEYVQAKRPDVPACLILDVELPGLSGLDLQAELAKSGIEMPIVFLTGHGDIPMSVRAMKAGAVEFLTKPFGKQELLDAIKEALLRDGEVRKQRSETFELRKRLGTLTPRERQVLALVVTGRLNKQIAGELGTTDPTIKVHRGRVMRKMGADSLADLVRMAEKLKISA